MMRGLVLLFALLTGVSASAETPAPPFSTCVNLSNALEAEKEGLWGYTIRDEDIARIAEAGFDAVRIPIRWSVHAGTERPYRIDPDFIARVDHVIATALAADLQVVINLHHFNLFYEKPMEQTERLLAIWDQIAARYRFAPDEVIFEMLNEPRGAATPKIMNALYPRLVETVRRTNPDRWIILGGANWGGVAGMQAMDPPEGKRLIASFHYYDPFSFTHQGADFITPMPPTGIPWGNAEDRARVETALGRAADFGKTHGMPVILGEFGAYQKADPDARKNWIAHVRQTAEAKGFAWCHWGWAMRFGVYDDDTEQWIEPIKRALLGP